MFTEKWEKLTGPQSQKMPKTRMSAVTKKYQKLECQQSWINAINTQVCGHGEM